MNATAVVEHYATGDLAGRVEAALQSVGFGNGQIPWSALEPIDQFHVGGIAATERLATGLKLAGGESVLDVGSGFGGPARYLATTYGCSVTGIDLTPAYVEVAEMLGRRTGLSHHLTFVQGNALDLPFSDESFDHVWTQHVAMNIADKARLYREIYRVLKPGGRLAIYDVLRGEGEPVLYPVPWARESTMSFLVTPEEMTEVLGSTGFYEITRGDLTEAGVIWFATLSASLPAGGSAFSLAAVLGGDEISKQALPNFARNLAEGRTQLWQIIAQKSR